MLRVLTDEEELAGRKKSYQQVVSGRLFDLATTLQFDEMRCLNVHSAKLMNFPATGEILAPYAIGHYLGGGMRGSHHMPLMPLRIGSPTSYFDGHWCRVLPCACTRAS